MTLDKLEIGKSAIIEKVGGKRSFKRTFFGYGINTKYRS